MSIDARRQYLKVQQRRYRQAARPERSRLLDEMVAVTGLNRKYLLYLLHTDLERKPRQRQRGRSYGPAVEEILLVVAESLDFICGKRLQPVLLSTARHLARHQELLLSPSMEAALAKISASTIDRLLARHRDRVVKRLPRKSPTRPSGVLRQVPMQIIPWYERQPGHLEVDLVWHSGPDTSGDFVYTLQMIDVATGWSERCALLGRSGMVTHDAFRLLRHRLPFPIQEIHTDNGAEFLSGHMLRFWSQEDPAVLLTRNRPWRKNDSRFVEQKNFTLVRAYLGYRRFDTIAQTRAINYLYELLGLYYNLFQPVMRLREKHLLPRPNQPPQLRRKYDTPKTPLQRLYAAKILDDTQQKALNDLQKALNPRQLRRAILELIDEINALPNAGPNDRQDVFYTLSRYRPYIVKGGWDARLGLHLTQPLPLSSPPNRSPG